jgi:hypothetical protein
MNNMQRRDFLTDTGRYILYGVMAVIAAFSLRNARPSSEADCTPGISCNDCKLLSGCDLDKAEEIKAAAKPELNS